MQSILLMLILTMFYGARQILSIFCIHHMFKKIKYINKMNKLLPFLLTLSLVSAQDESNNDEDSVVIFWSSFAFILFFMYIVIAVSSFPFMRFRTGIPVIFLLLIIAFPPSFFFLFTYLLLLRIGWMTTWWYVVQTQPMSENTVEIHAQTQAERRLNRV